MNNIFIHIGPGKTGSSFLQSAFALNQELYLKHGLNYPDLANNFSKAKIGIVTSGNATCIAANDVEKLFDVVKPLSLDDLRDRLNTDLSHLLSSEWMSGCSLVFLENLQEMFSNSFNVQFVAVVRDPVQQLVSNYLQGLKTNVYKYSIEKYFDGMLAETRRRLKLILSLKKSMHVVNYEFHKADLLVPFDNVFFGQRISEKPPLLEVNRSPDAAQAFVLQLINQLDISNFQAAMGYIQSSEDQTRPRYQLPAHLIDRVYGELEIELNEINKLLPPDEQLQRQLSQGADRTMALFNDHDSKFIAELISKNIKVAKTIDYKFIMKWTNKNDFEKDQNLPEGFNPVNYLLCNPDLVYKKVNPIKHYLNNGAKEGRKFK